MQPNDLFRKIIDEQSQIIGKKLAQQRALDAGVNIENPQFDSPDNTKRLLDNLVSSYGEVFGPSSIDVCLNVLKQYPSDQIDPFISEEIKNRLSKLS